MAQYNPIKFLLNQGSSAEEASDVSAPAFSLTKVLTAAAVIIGPIATVVVDQLKTKGLTSTDYVVLAVALLAFLAVTASADVIARSIVAAASKNLEASAAAVGDVVPFEKPKRGILETSTKDRQVQVLATAHDYVLVSEDGKTQWEPATKVTIT